MLFKARPGSFSLPLAGIILLSLPLSAKGADPSVPAPVTLAPVTVVGAMENPATGASSLDAPLIKSLPQGDGNLNELLKWLPDVQLSDQANSSATAGEILPTDISISGGKPYENNFMIDGLSSNNLLDPTSRSVTDISDIPSYPQGVFLNSTLIDHLTVYQSNIPARFGGFTGGVVTAETKNPGDRFNGHLSFRTTRDAWTNFHIDAAQEEAFRQSSNYNQEPRFEKYQAGCTLDIPLTNSTGLLVDYQLSYSTIPLNYFGSLQDQTRRLDNVLAKYRVELPNEDSLTLSAVSTPYRADYFLEDVKNSAYQIKSGSTTFNGGYRHNWQGGVLDIKAGYTNIEESRHAPSTYSQWLLTPSKDWGTLAGTKYSQEGGYGDLKRSQQDSQITADLTLSPKRTGPLTHTLSGGLAVDHTEAKLARPQTTVFYYGAKASSTVECGDDPACANQEQYFSSRTSYAASAVGASLNQFAVYGEDRIRFLRLELRPGARASYDSLMENYNLSPRLAASYDLFGNGRTILIGGLNRYYGHLLLTYKLREAIQPLLRETRELDSNGQLTPWQTSYTATSTTGFSHLKTPNTDEVTAGIDQALAGGRMQIRYVHRYTKDEFAKNTLGNVQPDGLRYYTLNNNGRSEHQSVQLSWERQWERQYLQINGTWQKTKSSNENFDEYLSISDLDVQVWYRGSSVAKADLPSPDYNRQYLANLIYSVHLPWGLSFTNTTHFRSGYNAIEDTGKNITLASGEVLDIYDEVKEPNSILFDWTLGWRHALDAKRSLTLTLTVLNVFDHQVHLGDASDEYELGRQFWAGLDIDF